MTQGRRTSDFVKYGIAQSTPAFAKEGDYLPKKDKKQIKRKLSAAFELPREIVLNLPVINMLGNEEVGIENYKGIVEYTAAQVRVLTSCGVIKIIGQELILKQVTAETIVIAGKIGHVGYM